MSIYRGGGERRKKKKNCFPEGRVRKGKVVSSYHRWIHRENDTNRGLISSKIAQSNLIQLLIDIHRLGIN